MEVDEQTIDKFAEKFSEKADPIIKENVQEVVGKEVADQVEDKVKELRWQRENFGKDLTGLNKSEKKQFAEDLKAVFNGQSEKAAILESSDQAGGYVVPSEVFEGILRISATAGHVARDARQFDMSSNELDIPTYSGSDLLGTYVGEDQDGTGSSDVPFDDSKLQAKKWMVILRMSNDMVNDAAVDLTDWLLSLVGEGRAARLDKEGFQGGTYAGSPFVGVLGSDDVTTYNLGGSDTSGSTSIADFDPVVDGSDITAQVETSIAGRCAWFFNRTAWAKIRQSVDSQNSPIININDGSVITNQSRNGITPVGSMWNYPVYTTDYLPGIDEDGADTKFGVFGSLRDGLMVGNRSDSMMVMESREGTVDGKNLLEADQRALRFTDRHAVSIGLPSALVEIETSSS